MVGRSIHKLLRTWFGLLINVLKREVSACAHMTLNELCCHYKIARTLWLPKLIINLSDSNEKCYVSISATRTIPQFSIVSCFRAADSQK